MQKRFPRFAATIVIALGLFLTRSAQAASAASDSAVSKSASVGSDRASPEGLLNQDGTLKLDGSFSGSLDLNGWNVQIDPERGPVFGPAATGLAAPHTPGDWRDLGGGGGGALNGEVRALAVMGTDIYVGGAFQDADNIPEADYIAKWDTLLSKWSAVGSNGHGEGSLNGEVFALAIAGASLYVGGTFYGISNGGISLPEACAVAKWDGTNWSALGRGAVGHPSIDSGIVYALKAVATTSGWDVYVGGNFVDVNNWGVSLPAADYIARWDGANWFSLGSNGGVGPALNGSLNGVVYAIEYGGGNVYVGGAFYDVNNGGAVLTAADYIARWNIAGASWWALGNNGPTNNGSLNSNVYALAITYNYLYVGGQFANVNDNGIPRFNADYIARWNGANWSAMGSDGTGEGSLNDVVYAIATDGDNIYVGGYFTNVNDGGAVLTAADRVARWDAGTSHWGALGGDSSGDGSISPTEVRALAVGPAHLLSAAGDFLGVANFATTYGYADRVAVWDGANWNPLGNSQGAQTDVVRAVVVSGTDVYVGGDFSDVSNHGTPIRQADHIAKWDGSDWSALGGTNEGEGSILGAVYAIAVSGSNVYVGGYFQQVIDGADILDTAQYIAMWDGSHWSGLGHGATASMGSLNYFVNAIAVSGSDVYVGGGFTNVNNKGTSLPAADYVARWDGSDWHALGAASTGNGSLNNWVWCLAVSGSDLYAGGDFTNVRDGATTLTAADYVARWDGSHWSALGNNGGVNGSIDSEVYAIAVSGTDVYIGGEFTDVNNNGTILDAADHIAKWDGASGWSALGGTDTGNGSLNGAVRAIVVSGPDVYAGGWFKDVVDGATTVTEADYIARWDGANWSALGNNGAGEGSLGGAQDVYVYAMAMDGADVIAGGRFFNVNNNGTVLQYADHIAAYNLPTISGNAGVGGAALNYGGAAITADASGNYSFPVAYDWTGTVTPSKLGYSFSDHHKNYTDLATNQTSQDYTATLRGAPIPRIYPPDGSQACRIPQVGADLMLTNLMRKNGSFDPATITLKLDTVDVLGSASILQTSSYPASLASILYTPPNGLSLGGHLVALTYPTASGPVTLEWKFTVAGIVCTSSGTNRVQLYSDPLSGSTDPSQLDFGGIQAP